MSTGCNHQGRQAGNSWKIRVREPSVPQVCFALRELSDLLLEYTGKLPGISAEETVSNIIELSVRPDDVPENGYRITVEPPENGRQRVVIRGYDPTSLMYGCMDFCFNRIPEMSLSRTTANPYYFKRLFAEDALPPADAVSVPHLLRRGLWTWGSAVYDWRGYLENMARLRLNELILWNDFAPINGQEIVRCAHELGIRILWGYAWGWDTTMRLDTSEEASRRIVDTYEREYAALDSDGIYFQSFTETSRETLDGRLIAEAVAEFVNRTAEKLLRAHPHLRLQFGLHADSVRNHLDCIANVDPRIEIIWENCGGFPYHSCPDVIGSPAQTEYFTQRLLSLRPNAPTGAVLKGMTQLDWQRFRHQSAPEMLGCAGEQEIQSRWKDVQKIWRYLSGEWIDHGERCADILRLYAAKPDTAVYGLVENGLFERHLSLPAVLYANLAWDPDQDWQSLLRRMVQNDRISI